MLQTEYPALARTQATNSALACFIAAQHMLQLLRHTNPSLHLTFVYQAYDEMLQRTQRDTSVKPGDYQVQVHIIQVRYAKFPRRLCVVIGHTLSCGSPLHRHAGPRLESRGLERAV